MKILLFLLLQFLSINFSFSQVSSQSHAEHSDEFKKQDIKKFKLITKDSIGNKYYLLNYIVDSFYSYDTRMLYSVYVQILKPNFIYNTPYPTRRANGEYKNVKVINKWVIDFQTDKYYLSAYKILDSSMNYITGDTNDVYVWKKVEQGTVEYKILTKAKKILNRY
jgi:hypothetical protein